ncbi:MAG: PqiC family protein [bacterium]|uniref:PqiC family protein n=1 Tax=Candidatus Methylomirabilis tolerans TaxID=3123416 RepID=A0AAJ1AIK9_9BACT|nr:PqiC family protein [Candidatus Methylomirabilis sp.]
MGIETSNPAVPSNAGLAVGIRRVALPDYLDRPQIVTRAGPNTLDLAEFDRWAAPLAETFPRILAENLAGLIPTDRVAAFPWPKGAQPDYEVTVEVTQLEGRLGGECVLIARWSVFGRESKALLTTGKSSLTESAGGDYETLVAATSRLIGALSRDIATAVKTIPREEE